MDPLGVLAAIGLAAGAGAVGTTAVAIRRSATQMEKLGLDRKEEAPPISSEVQDVAEARRAEQHGEAADRNAEEEGEAGA